MRTFELIADDTQVHYPSREGVLYVRDIIKAGLTSIKVDTLGDRSFDLVLEASDYELLPHIGRDGRTDPRAQQINIWPRSSRSFPMNTLVEIVSDRGWVEDDGSPPALAQEANLLQASRWFQRKDTALTVMQMPGFGFKRLLDGDPDVKAMLVQGGLVHEIKDPVMA